MFCSSKWFRSVEWFWRRPRLVLLLFPLLIGITFYAFSGENGDIENFDFLSLRSYHNVSDELVDGYLVWNSKCHMISKDPLDSSIAKFIQKQSYEPCAKHSHLTHISREPDGNFALVFDPRATLQFEELNCCWSPISRPSHIEPVEKNIDSKILTGPCQRFTDKVILPKGLELLMVSCTTKVGPSPKDKAKKKNSNKKPQTVYENVHTILNPEKVEERLNATENATGATDRPRKLSILVLGIDNVSRLNFRRSLPKTANWIENKGFITMKGYNKMGENTFPNLMAILTGQSMEMSYQICKPKELYGLDRCPMIWYDFRKQGYVTSYAEDEVRISTFNFLKAGFVEPPVDYYLRPYMIASEKMLKSRTRFRGIYCAGPELTIDRIYNFGVEFAKTFSGVHPYFGFFWSNSVSHDDVNGVSMMDDKMVRTFEDLDSSGVFNETMLIFLSDHGMRYGNIRNTFVGWYEERLPFLHIWLPKWFREQDPEAYTSLQINQNRLTSPFDLHMTLRDILMRAGGERNVSSGCPICSSLFRPVPFERGCEDVGVSPHWCTCKAFVPRSTTDQIATDSAKILMEYVEGIIKDYKDNRGKRLCAKLRLKKVHRVDQLIDVSGNKSSVGEYFFMLEVEPGGGKFEATIRNYAPGNYSLAGEDISRINSYSKYAKCLTSGLKQYCYCTNLL